MFISDEYKDLFAIHNKLIDEYATKSRNTYILEVAGRDSLAAVSAYLKKRAHDVKDFEIQPTIVLTGTEYGDFKSYISNLEYVNERCSEYGIVCKKPLLLSDFKLWNLLNAHFSYFLTRKFGFHFTCIGCHCYAHILRVPLYYQINASGIISGERISHNGIIKINQSEYVLSSFREAFSVNGVTIIQPLFNVVTDIEINDLIGKQNVFDNSNGVKCALSGNHFGLVEREQNWEAKLIQYFDLFLNRVIEYICHNILDNTFEYNNLEILLKELLDV